MSSLVRRLLCLLSIIVTTNVAHAQAQEESVTAVGKTKVNAILASWYVDDQSTDMGQTFRIRRAELKIGGSVAEGTRWYMMLDASKSPGAGAIDTTKDNKVLQDLVFGINLIEGLELMMGQFKIPGPIESALSSGDLSLPERSLLARTFGERRDQGVALNYKYGIVKGTVSHTNGQTASNASANVNESNYTKDFNGRLDVSLLEGALNIGAFGGQGRAGAGTTYTSKSLAGASIGGKWEGFFGHVEHGERKDMLNNATTTYTISNVEAGYRFNPEYMLAARHEIYKSKTDTTDTVEGKASTLGLTYFLAGKNMKAQLSHTMMNEMDGKLGAYDYSLNKADKGMTVFALLITI